MGGLYTDADAHDWTASMIVNDSGTNAASWPSSKVTPSTRR